MLRPSAKDIIFHDSAFAWHHYLPDWKQVKTVVVSGVRAMICGMLVCESGAFDYFLSTHHPKSPTKVRDNAASQRFHADFERISPMCNFFNQPHAMRRVSDHSAGA